MTGVNIGGIAAMASPPAGFPCLGVHFHDETSATVRNYGLTG